MVKLKHKGQIFFTFQNNSGSAQTFILFQTVLINQFLGGVVTVTGSVNYNFINNMIHENPLLFRVIQYSYSNQATSGIALQWMKLDANGKQFNDFDIPLNEISAYQRQGNISTIKYKNLFIDGRTTLQITLPAGESIELLIDYEQWKRTDQFSTPEPQSVFEKELMVTLPKESDMKTVRWDEKAIKKLPVKKMFDSKQLDNKINWA